MSIFKSTRKMTAKELMAFELGKLESENKIIILKADLAHAIGYCRGLGHPETYLEKNYPELVGKQVNETVSIVKKAIRETHNQYKNTFKMLGGSDIDEEQTSKVVKELTLALLQGGGHTTEQIEKELNAVLSVVTFTVIPEVQKEMLKEVEKISENYVTSTQRRNNMIKDSWKERFEKRFKPKNNCSAHPTRHDEYCQGCIRFILEDADEMIEFIASEISIAHQQGAEEERDTWINQKANQHDERIRQAERERILEIIKQFDGYDCGKPGCKDQVKNILKSLDSSQ